MSNLAYARGGGKLTVAAGVLAAGLCIPSCADPEGEFDDFVVRWNEIHADDGDSGPAGDGGECAILTQDDVANGYLFTLSASITPVKPFLAVTTVTIESNVSPPTISFSVQPLNAKDRVTPVGAPILGGPVPIEADGSFVADFGNIRMEGDANPISGNPLETTLTLVARPGGLCKESTFVCGDAKGIASKPIQNLNLEGSTFTMQQLDAPGNYPEPLLSCSDTPGN